MKLTREHFRSIICYHSRRGLSGQECIDIYIHTYLAQTPEIGQGLGRFLSCGARKQEQP